MPGPNPDPTPIDGWKTKAGAIVKIFTGGAAVLAALAALITHFVNPDAPNGIGLDAFAIAALAGIFMIGDGIAALGLGHKLDKNTAAIKENTVSAKVSAIAAAETATPVVIVPTKPVDPAAALLENFALQVQEAAGDPDKLAALKAKVSP